jgi:hypothetical protein
VHEEHIREGGKTVHVVFKYKYLYGSLLQKGVHVVSGYSFKDDVTIMLLLGVSFMLKCN